MKLAIIIAFLISGISTTFPDTDPCDNLKVEAEIFHTSDGLENGSVEVKVEGGVEPYVYIFMNEKGKPISFENKLNKLSDAKSGIVYCTVIDKEGCQKKLEINIK